MKTTFRKVDHVAEQSSDTRQTEDLSCRNGYYEGSTNPRERITTNLETSIQNLYLPCKPILYNENRLIQKNYFQISIYSFNPIF